MYKAISRADGEYVRIPSAAGWTVFTTAEIRGAEVVPNGEARLHFDLALTEHPESGNRSASHAWRESTLTGDYEAEVFDILREVFGSVSHWRNLKYRKVATVLRASAKLDPKVPADAALVHRTIEWARPKDPRDDRDYLYRAGIWDPTEPAYSNIDQWLDVA